MTDRPTLLDLILKARASDTRLINYHIEGGRWLRVDVNQSRTRYVLGSGFAERDYLTRKGAANVCRKAIEDQQRAGAYNLGAFARLRGDGLGMNPHNEGTVRHEAWCSGWCDENTNLRSMDRKVQP